jgi:hypothetical protein
MYFPANQNQYFEDVLGKFGDEFDDLDDSEYDEISQYDVFDVIGMNGLQVYTISRIITRHIGSKTLFSIIIDYMNNVCNLKRKYDIEGDAGVIRDMISHATR